MGSARVLAWKYGEVEVVFRIAVSSHAPPPLYLRRYAGFLFLAAPQSVFGHNLPGMSTVSRKSANLPEASIVQGPSRHCSLPQKEERSLLALGLPRGEAHEGVAPAKLEWGKT